MSGCTALLQRLESAERGEHADDLARERAERDAAALESYLVDAGDVGAGELSTLSERASALLAERDDVRQALAVAANDLLASAAGMLAAAQQLAGRRGPARGPEGLDILEYEQMDRVEAVLHDADHVLRELTDQLAGEHSSEAARYVSTTGVVRLDRSLRLFTSDGTARDSIIDAQDRVAESLAGVDLAHRALTARAAELDGELARLGAERLRLLTSR